MYAEMLNYSSVRTKNNLLELTGLVTLLLSLSFEKLQLICERF